MIGGHIYKHTDRSLLVSIFRLSGVRYIQTAICCLKPPFIFSKKGKWAYEDLKNVDRTGCATGSALELY
jgi:hypothetical protein